jgi:hypothetical protein
VYVCVLSNPPFSHFSSHFLQSISAIPQILGDSIHTQGRHSDQSGHLTDALSKYGEAIQVWLDALKTTPSHTIILCNIAVAINDIIDVHLRRRSIEIDADLLTSSEQCGVSGDEKMEEENDVRVEKSQKIQMALRAAKRKARCVVFSPTALSQQSRLTYTQARALWREARDFLQRSIECGDGKRPLPHITTADILLKRVLLSEMEVEFVWNQCGNEEVGRAAAEKMKRRHRKKKRKRLFSSAKHCHFALKLLFEESGKFGTPKLPPPSLQRKERESDDFETLWHLTTGERYHNKRLKVYEREMKGGDCNGNVMSPSHHGSAKETMKEDEDKKEKKKKKKKKKKRDDCDLSRNQITVKDEMIITTGVDSKLNERKEKTELSKSTTRKQTQTLSFQKRKKQKRLPYPYHLYEKTSITYQISSKSYTKSAFSFLGTICYKLAEMLESERIYGKDGDSYKSKSHRKTRKRKRFHCEETEKNNFKIFKGNDEFFLLVLSAANSFIRALQLLLNYTPQGISHRSEYHSLQEAMEKCSELHQLLGELLLPQPEFEWSTLLQNEKCEFFEVVNNLGVAYMLGARLCK